MNDETLATTIEAKLREATGFVSSNYTAEREESLRFYLGEPFGNEEEGRSQVISRDVMDTVEWVMPALMEMFHGSEKAVEFAPTGPEDEDAAEQATDYCNHIYLRDNNGFLNTYTALKDGLIQNVGVSKVWCETVERVEEQAYQGLSDAEMEEILGGVEEGDEIEVLEHDSREEMVEPPPELALMMDPAMGPPPPIPVTLHDIRVRRTKQVKIVRVEGVPPEEFVTEPRARSLESCRFMAQVTTKTRSELIDDGYDPSVINSLAAYAARNEDAIGSGEREARFGREDRIGDEATPADRSMELIQVSECIVLIDYDGDGRAERRKIILAGGKVLFNEPFDDDLFVAWSPIILPHSLIGISLADTVKDLQWIKSNLMRQMLDGLYLTNEPEMIVNEIGDGEVNYDDLLAPKRAGRILRTKGQSTVTPLLRHWEGAQAFPMLEWLDRVREERTGTSSQQMGLDSDILQNQTATAVNLSMSAAQQRIALIARIFAETYMKPLFRAILRLSIRYMDRERVVRLRNEWTPLDPRGWSADMDVTVNVGLGTGSKDQQIAHLGFILANQKEALGEGGLGMVGPKQIYNTLAQATRIAGFPSVDPFFVDPESPDAAALQQQGGGGEEDGVAALAQAEMAKAQAQQAKVEADLQVKAAELERKAMELQLKDAERARKDQEFELQAYKVVQELQLKAAELGHKIDMDWTRGVVQGARIG